MDSFKSVAAITLASTIERTGESAAALYSSIVTRERWFLRMAEKMTDQASTNE